MKVIAKAHKGKPHALELIREEDGVSIVTGSDEKHSIGYPTRDIFVYDDATFRALGLAYESGDPEYIRAAWGKAQRFIFRKAAAQENADAR